MCRLLLITVACLLILFGSSGLWMLPKLLQQKIEQRIQLKIGTQSFDRFVKVPIALTVKFYLFNITNSDRVLQGLERPKFQETGPFMYKQWRRRQIVDFEDYNRKLKYREIKTYVPMPINSSAEQPMLDPNLTKITLINVPLLSALTKLAQLDEGSFKRELAVKALGRLLTESKEKILVTRTANQFLFQGYKVDLLESVRDLISETLNFNFESPLPKNIFGFFYNKNDTWNRREAGELTIHTGRNGSMDKFMQIESWNEQQELRVWPTDTKAGSRCNEVRGTDGSQFNPGVKQNQVLSIFTPLLCSSIQLKYKEETSTKGIPLMRFTASSDMFAAPRKNPKNACFCTIPERSNSSSTNGNHKRLRKITDSRCYIDGLMDLSPCQRGAPVAASWPHFYNGDPMLAIAAGLRPEQKIHETFVDVEPMTGTVFRASARAQMNAFVEQAALDVVDTSLIGNMTAMVAPLFWLEEAAEIDDKNANMVKGQLINVIQKVRRTFIYSIVIGLVLFLIVSIQFWYVTCYSIDSSSKHLNDGCKKKKASLAKRGRCCRRNLLQISGRGHLEANLSLGMGARGSNRSNKRLGKTIISPEAVRELGGTGTDDDDQDELNKNLMVNEWELGQVSPNTSSNGRSSHNEGGTLNQAAAISATSSHDQLVSQYQVQPDRTGSRYMETDLSGPSTSSS